MKRYDTEAFLLRAETLLNEKFFDIYIYMYIQLRSVGGSYFIRSGNLLFD